MFYVRKFLFSRPKVNKVIVLLTLSDIFTWGIHFVVLALVGIYISERLGQNAVQIVGIGSAVYTGSRGLLELPVGRLTDIIRFDHDEIVILSLGNIIMGTSYLFYPLISSPSAYYALQFTFAVGAAMNLVSWKKLFAANLDRNAEGQEYGEYGLVMGLSTAVFGIVAGSVANLGMPYFHLVIVVIGVMTMFSSIFAFSIFSDKKRNNNL